MRINFKRLYPKAVLPRKAYESDYAFDCVAVSEEELREDSSALLWVNSSMPTRMEP